MGETIPERSQGDPKTQLKQLLSDEHGIWCKEIAAELNLDESYIRQIFCGAKRFGKKDLVARSEAIAGLCFKRRLFNASSQDRDTLAARIRELLDLMAFRKERGREKQSSELDNMSPDAALSELPEEQSQRLRAFLGGRGVPAGSPLMRAVNRAFIADPDDLARESRKERVREYHGAMKAWRGIYEDREPWRAYYEALDPVAREKLDSGERVLVRIAGEFSEHQKSKPSMEVRNVTGTARSEYLGRRFSVEILACPEEEARPAGETLLRRPGFLPFYREAASRISSSRASRASCLAALARSCAAVRS